DDETIVKRTILFDGQVAGNILSWEHNGTREICYWIARMFWGKGIATDALLRLLDELTKRPLYARAAKDNVASIRVLQKCGFAITGFDKGFANARGTDIEEAVLELLASSEDDGR